MNHRGDGSWLRGRRRIGACAALLAFAASAAAQSTFEFVAHNGFEACWTTAKDKTTLAALIVDYIEGAPGCIPANPGGNPSFCYDTVCTGGVAGCPTILHASSAQYAQGQSRFDVQGGLDSIAGKITFPLVGECTFSIDTSNITLEYPISYYSLPEYGLVADGNNGYYLTGLNVGDMVVTGLTGSAVSVGGNLACVTASFGLGYFSGVLVGVAPSIDTAVQPTLDYAWCPWPF